MFVFEVIRSASAYHASGFTEVPFLARRFVKSAALQRRVLAHTHSGSGRRTASINDGQSGISDL